MSETVEKMLGNSPGFLRMIHAAHLVGGTRATVFINGERGAGRQSLVRLIHQSGGHRREQLRVVNCAGMPVPELGAELTACFDAEAVVEQSEQAPMTLFLHQVEELNAASQLRLLHYLQNGNQSAVRLISSASADLPAMLERGDFRQDLFYRLYVVPLEVPPLRERQEDIVLLINHFTAGLARLHGRKPPHYSVSARNLLKAYSWPGNLTELQNLSLRMLIMMAGKTVQPENLPFEIRQGSGRLAADTGFVLPAEGVDLLALESTVIRQALGMSGGNRSRAARLLRISRDTLLYRIQKHAIEI